MRGLVTNDALTDEITRAREQQGDDWQQRLDEQYDGRFYERLQEAWGNEWSTRLDLVLQGNNDTWLIEQIRNESYALQAGNKRYELANHMGNVLAVVSDKKEQSDGVTWSAIVVSAQDYFPFGMAMPGRNSGSYRYGVTGKERDTEIETYDFGARFYQSNLGRWLSADPWESKYPAWSTYNYTMNSPLRFIDPTGKGVTGDYYDEKGKKIGNDDKKDKRSYVVTGAAVSELQAEQSQNGKISENIVNKNINDVYLLPSLEARAEMKTAMDEAHNKPISYELGGIGYYNKPVMGDNPTPHFPDGDVTHVRAADGVSAVGSLATVNVDQPHSEYQQRDESVMKSVAPMYNRQQGKPLRPAYSQIAYTWHSHPNETSYGQFPSSLGGAGHINDLQFAAQYTPRTSNFVLSAKNNEVYLYKSTTSASSPCTCAGQMSLSTFYKLGAE